MGMQSTARALVLPDVAVDRLVTDREQPVAPQPPGDLLGAPVLADQCLDTRLVGLRELRVPARAGAASPGIPVRQLRAVRAVAVRVVAVEFANDRAPMPPHDPGGMVVGDRPCCRSRPSVYLSAKVIWR